jgi:hypothetical protein
LYKSKSAQPRLLLMTDGEDNSSSPAEIKRFEKLAEAFKID